MAKTAIQIAEVVRRGVPIALTEYDVDRLGRELALLSKDCPTFADFVPIRLVTLLETAVRNVVAEAVDHGEPYTARGAALLNRSGARALTVEVLLSVNARQLTLGHLVSHAISTSSVSEIISALTAVLGDGLRDALAASTERWIEDEGRTVPPIITDIGACLSGVDRLLTARHILVHELPRSQPYDAAELPAFIAQARAFISALEWLLVARTKGRVPRTQREMNGWAARSRAAAEDELSALTGPVPSSLDACRTLQDRVEYFWHQFSSHAADLAAGYGDDAAPGSVAPMLRASALERLTRWRTEEIRLARAKLEGES